MEDKENPVMDKVISTKWGQNLMEEHMLLTIQGKFPNLFNISSNLSSIGQQTRIQYLKSKRKRACVVKKMNQDIHEITQSIREKMVCRNWYSWWLRTLISAINLYMEANFDINNVILFCNSQKETIWILCWKA